MIEWATKAASPEEAARAEVERLTRILGSQAEAIAAYVASSGGRVTVAEVLAILAEPTFAAALSEALEGVVGSAMAAGADAGTAALPESIMFDTLTNERVVDAARARLGRLADRLGESTSRQVVDAVSRGVEQGQSIDDIAAGIRQAVGDPRRAEMIARTETAHAYSEGQIMAWREAGVTAKRWVLAPDPCEFCEAAADAYGEGGESKRLNEPFYALGSTITGADGGTYKVDWQEIQGPPLHPACRCSLIPVLEGEE